MCGTTSSLTDLLFATCIDQQGPNLSIRTVPMFKTVFHFRVQSGTSRQGDSRERLASAVRQSLQENLIILDYAYPKIKIDLLFVESDEFSPELVAKLSADTGILPSFMFIRCPGKSFKCNIGEFDGLRTIMR